MGRKPAISEFPARDQTSWRQVSVGVLVLLLGSLVYVLDRPPESVPFFDTINFSHLVPNFFFPLGGNLPAFAHAFAFSLLTAAWLGGRRHHALYACGFWFSVDCLFELGQHPVLAPQFSQLFPDHFDAISILKHVEMYFVFGRFDNWDLVSIALGASTAYLFVLWTLRMDE